MIDHDHLSSIAMLCYSEQQFIRALRREPERRNIQVSLGCVIQLWNCSDCLLSGPTSDLHASGQYRSSKQAEGIRTTVLVFHGEI